MSQIKQTLLTVLIAIAMLSMVLAHQYVDTWILTFYISRDSSFVGGEYQTEELCKQGAKRQLPWVRRQTMAYDRVRWSCVLERAG
jgi:hypothetical protein